MPLRIPYHLLLLGFLLSISGLAKSQCSNYTISVTAGLYSNEVSWSLVNSGGVTVASGFAPITQVYCLPAGCYTLNMYDSYGDGWNNSVFTITSNLGQNLWSGTLNSGFSGTATFAIGGGACGGNPNCGFNITVGGGLWDAEVSWTLTDENGTAVASGFAPTSVSACLPPGCYTMLMYDSYGDGWNGAVFTVSDPNGNLVGSGGMPGGSFGSVSVDVGGGNCGGGGGGCDYTMVVGGGLYDEEISWSLNNDLGATIGAGWAPASTAICLETGCYVMNMYDSYGDGWDFAAWAIYDNLGNTVTSGTLPAGSYGTYEFSFGGADCGIVQPITASDCIDAVNVCTDLNFAIDPNGYGNILEIPTLGTVSNPEYGIGVYNPWGTTNWGCLMNGELNSTWMIVNISGSGWLDFTFGGLGMQVGFYDWIMWPYDADACQDIYYNLVPPVRCNWNGVSFGGTGLANILPPGGDPTNFEPSLYVYAGEQYLICFSNWSSVSSTVPLQFGGTAIVSCQPLLLPVSLLDFSCEAQNAAVELNWVTASESNNRRFVIERSTDLEQWKDILEVQGSGDSQELLRYSAKDTKPENGWNYYRLRQEDFNGESTDSELISCWFETSSGPIVLSNPNNGNFEIKGIEATNIYQMMLYSASGEKVETNVYAENGHLLVEVKNPKTGVYVLKISNNEGDSFNIRVLISEE